MEKGYQIETILIDTGIVYALADKKDSWHKKSVAFITKLKGTLIIPSPVISEVCYLLNTYLGQTAEYKFINSLINKEISIEHFSTNDLNHCMNILNKYSDMNIGFVDACLIAMAERLKITEILTTDRRHFSVIKPSHCMSFTLLP